MKIAVIFMFLICCVGVSFASDDFNDSFIDDSDDESYLNDIDEEIDEFEDEDIDDEEIDDFDDEDVDEFDDEDFEDEEIDDLEDEDFEDDDEIDYSESGHYTEDGITYYYETVFYKSGRAIGCAYMADSVSDDASDDEDKIMHKNDTSSSNKNESVDVLKHKSLNHKFLSKSLKINDLKEESSLYLNSTAEKTSGNETAVIKTQDNYLSVLAFLAVIVISMLVIL